MELKMTIPTKFRRALAAMLTTLTLLIACGAAWADNEFYYNIGYSMDNNYWTHTPGDYHASPYESNAQILDVIWEERGFCTYTDYPYEINTIKHSQCLAAGLSGMEYPFIPYIQSKEAVTDIVSGIEIICDIIPDYINELSDAIILEVATSSAFGEEAKKYRPIITRTQYDSRIKVLFNIQFPSHLKYYKINFDIKSHKQNWFKVLQIRFALPESTLTQPVYSDKNIGPDSYEVTISDYNADFKLHVMWGKYNESGERLEYFYDGIEPTSEDAQNETDIITDLSKSWQNDVGQTYTHTFAPTGTDYYILRAKNVNKNDPYHQSNDIVKIIKNDGIITGIDGVNPDVAITGTEDNVRWFNLQGSPVAQPEGHGIFIRVCNGKSSKVLL